MHWDRVMGTDAMHAVAIRMSRSVLGSVSLASDCRPGDIADSRERPSSDEPDLPMIERCCASTGRASDLVMDRSHKTPGA